MAKEYLLPALFISSFTGYVMAMPEASLPHLQTLAAKPPVHSNTGGTLNFVFENDIFCGTDRHYTNGLSFLWIPNPATSTPAWATNLASHVPWFPDEGTIQHSYSFGQSMFVPENIKLRNPPLDDRPYAGWLYGSIGLNVKTGTLLDQISFIVGMVGPAAMAESGQKLIHRIFDSSPVPKGWDTQLDNEPGLMLVDQRSWREFSTVSMLDYNIDFTPHAGVALGNVFTYANSGITVRFGKHLPRDFGPPRIIPGLPGSGSFVPATAAQWYLFTGTDVRAVAHNIFLDGNSFHDSRSVDKRTLVGDLQFGFVIDWQKIRFSYTQVVRTHEFQTQNNNDIFGAFSLSSNI